MTKHLINTGAILMAMEYWEEQWGFSAVSVPMCVSNDAMKATCPLNAKDYRYEHYDSSGTRYYVASAEQSFIQRILDGNMADNARYMALTPCYRGDEADATHYDIFLKLELFAYPKTDDKNSAEMEACELAFAAKDLFVKLGLDESKLEVVDTLIGYDVMYDEKLELGSYGGRLDPNGRWYIYATGIAEPRFSMAHYSEFA